MPLAGTLDAARQTNRISTEDARLLGRYRQLLPKPPCLRQKRKLSAAEREPPAPTPPN